MNQIQIAATLAQKAHAGQFRRDGKTPYITHPMRVSRRVAPDEDAEAVAWLHDILEDCDVTAQDLLQAGIPLNVVTAVEVLTKRDEDYAAYLRAVKANGLATRVKVADMLDNLSDGPSQKQIVKYAEGLLFLLRD